MKKQICFISPKFSSHIGGMETHAYEFARVFATNSDYPIAAILTKALVNDGIPVPGAEDQDGITRSQATAEKYPYVVEKTLTGDFSQDAATILNRCDIDNTILYLNSTTWLPAIQRIKHQYPHAQVVVRSGGNDIIAGWIGDENDISTGLEQSRQRIVEMLNAYADLLIVNSTFSLHRSAAVGVKPEKMVVITGGVDCRMFRPPLTKKQQTTCQIVTVARLVQFKGFQYAVAAIKRLVDQGLTNMHYTIVGDGPERSHIEDLIRRHGLADYISIVGAKHIEDIPCALQQADIFLHMPVLLPKHERGAIYIHTETMGRGLCEASATGLPIVASRVGGIPEVVEDTWTGFLVKEKDAQTAADKLSYLMQNPDLRCRMGRRGRQRAQERFDWSHVFRQYRELFDDISTTYASRRWRGMSYDGDVSPQLQNARVP